ncbi:hypothetical protein [Pasteuria penetrans]|uniref:hypothetical protein n=1 Tax=Pasteuria penetrans TaxID=86005 RepID=UPI001CAA7D05|nr:hypothetical protein [Pasteuria penetrans]
MDYLTTLWLLTLPPAAVRGEETMTSVDESGFRRKEIVTESRGRSTNCQYGG